MPSANFSKRDIFLIQLVSASACSAKQYQNNHHGNTLEAVFQTDLL